MENENACLVDMEKSIVRLTEQKEDACIKAECLFSGIDLSYLKTMTAVLRYELESPSKVYEEVERQRNEFKSRILEPPKYPRSVRD